APLHRAPCAHPTPPTLRSAAAVLPRDIPVQHDRLGCLPPLPATAQELPRAQPRKLAALRFRLPRFRLHLSRWQPALPGRASEACGKLPCHFQKPANRLLEETNHSHASSTAESYLSSRRPTSSSSFPPQMKEVPELGWFQPSHP